MSDYKELVKKLTKSEFDEFVLPFLPKAVSGSKQKIAPWKTYNYIVKVLRTGMQWSELQDFIDKDGSGKPEIHYTSVFKRFQQWESFGVFNKSYEAILVAVHQAKKLDLSILNGDGTNTVSKKGVKT
jgi:hypothetical protein